MRDDRSGEGALADPFDLLGRTGLPAELTPLLAKHPRETWEDPAAVGEAARFWLERHALLRRLGGALAAAAADFRESRTDPEAFVAWFAPRLELYLGELHTHHLVEDRHYFPVFLAAEPRLARGFAILDADHATIDRLLRALAGSANALAAATRGEGDLARTSARLSERIDAMLPAVARHLEDEEDLVIPLLAARGDALAV